jgi:hypothetical protein
VGQALLDFASPLSLISVTFSLSQITVPEIGAHLPDGHPSFEQVGREAMPQSMTSGVLFDSRCAEEGHLDVAGEDMERQEPALALDAVKWRVPPHGLARCAR